MREDCTDCHDTGVLGSTGTGFGEVDYCHCDEGQEQARVEDRARDREEDRRDWGY